MRIIGIIPARMESSRYPNKPLAKIHGIPMVGHCFLRSKMCSLLDEVYVATCNQEVVDYIASIGGQAIMTANTHERASDRAAEAMLKAEAMTGKKTDVVVMIQGDEPMLTPEMLTEAIAPMKADASIEVLNLMGDVVTREEHDDPNEVKVVVDRKGDALYFSREPIPSWRKGAKVVPMKKQICIIPFRREFLLKFNSLPQTPLEIVESVDMLRCLEYGHKVRMVPTTVESYSVDTPEDLRDVEAAMQGDALMKKYAHLRR
jgi:3-deoxy-manno-octulosonate cytidylyltransferase (CMP-KDO synthetase)